MDKRITVSIETSFSDTHFTRGTDRVMTDRELKSLAVDEFIHDLNRTFEENDLRSYVEVSID